ncbi:hypothetical protein D3C78_18410 [compost metagenome]
MPEWDEDEFDTSAKTSVDLMGYNPSAPDSVPVPAPLSSQAPINPAPEKTLVQDFESSEEVPDLTAPAPPVPPAPAPAPPAPEPAPKAEQVKIQPVAGAVNVHETVVTSASASTSTPAPAVQIRPQATPTPAISIAPAQEKPKQPAPDLTAQPQRTQQQRSSTQSQQRTQQQRPPAQSQQRSQQQRPPARQQTQAQGPSGGQEAILRQIISVAEEAIRLGESKPDQSVQALINSLQSVNGTNLDAGTQQLVTELKTRLMVGGNEGQIAKLKELTLKL